MKHFLLKMLIKVKSYGVSPRRLRHRYKQYCENIVYNRYAKELKWGVSLSLFNGEELLPFVLQNIRPQVDYINVVYQNVSWYGEESKLPLKPQLDKLQQQGLIDEIIFFEPDMRKTAGQNERQKRNLGLQAAKKRAIDYYMTMDVDEFYFADEIKEAKYQLIKKNIRRSFVKQEPYGDSPCQKKLYHKECFVPFFSRINRLSRHQQDKKIPCLCDPTRQLNQVFIGKYYLLNNCSMQHMMRVRKDIKSKYRNASNKDSRKPKGNEREELIAKDIPNWFGIEM